MHTYCNFLAISCLLDYNLPENHILVKIGSEFMELSSKQIFVKSQSYVTSGNLSLLTVDKIFIHKFRKGAKYLMNY